MKPNMKDWDHLSLKEVAEVEALSLVIVGEMPVWGRQGRSARLAELLARRVRPLYDDKPTDAA
ncbi:MAG TPA: hypothetical protein VNH39_01205 [Steroidobacteraceae bacterium]|nr:hypothetical protein [Steroidobacteraceae bacterium]